MAVDRLQASKLLRLVVVACLVVLGLSPLIWPSAALASPFQLSYAGRLNDASGKPLVGPVDLQIKLYSHPTDPTLIPVTIPLFEDIALKDGVFQLPLNLTGAEYQTAFGTSGDVWIELKDVTHNKIYPRQSFLTVPYALKVPVDDLTLNYAADGKLQIKTDNAPANLKVLKINGSGTLTWGDDLTSGVGSVSNTDLQPNVITTDKIANGTILAADIGLGAITDDRFATIATAGKVADTALSAQVTKLGSSIDLDSEVVNTLPVANGGTGATTLTGLLKGNGTGALSAAALADVPVGYRLNAADGSPTEALYVDNSGYVGIGTTSPSTLLTVEKNLNWPTVVQVNNTDAGGSAASQVSLSANGSNLYLGAFSTASLWGGNSVVTSGVGDDLILGSDIMARVTIRSGGNVGIGTTSPDVPLMIQSNTADAFRINRNSSATGDGVAMYLSALNSSGIVKSYAGLSAIIDNSTAGAENGSFAIKTTSAGSLTEKVRVLANGNVGIGTTAPDGILTVVNDGNSGYFDRYSSTSWNSQPTINLRRGRGTSSAPVAVNGGDVLGWYGFRGHDGTSFGSISGGFSASATEAFTPTAHGTSLALSTTPNGSVTSATRLVVDQAGHIGIGTSTPDSAALMHLFGSTPRLWIQNSTNAATSTLAIKDFSNSQGGMFKESATGTAMLSLGANPLDGTSNSQIRLFDTSTNTTGSKLVSLFKGNGTSTVDTQIGVDGAATYFNGGGNVGIGTTAPATTLDVAGTMRLAKNAAQPYACDATHDAALALTSTYKMCACKNGVGWVYTSDGTSACVW